MARNGSAQWNGTLQDGKGTLTVGDSAWTGNYSFKSRFEDGEGRFKFGVSHWELTLNGIDGQAGGEGRRAQ